jgi:hypothetical protein
LLSWLPTKDQVSRIADPTTTCGQMDSTLATL